MRKSITKNVSMTNVKVAKYEIDEDNQPITVILPNETFIGQLSKEKVMKLLSSKYSEDIFVYEIKYILNTYEMDIEEFIKYARLKETKGDE